MVALAVLVMFFAWMNYAKAYDERQIRRDCTYDALRYCKTAIAAATEQACRQPIIACMLQNRDNLQPKCKRHLY